MHNMLLIKEIYAEINKQNSKCLRFLLITITKWPVTTDQYHKVLFDRKVTPVLINMFYLQMKLLELQ